MMKLTEIVSLRSGSPQFRIKESSNDSAPTYFYYGQQEMDDDLIGLAQEEASSKNKKAIRTNDEVSTLKTGDLIFSLITGKASVVGSSHDGYLFTQNFVKITPSSSVDVRYFVYLLNENDDIRRQLLKGQQGSKVLKYTIKQLSDLFIPDLPPLEMQQIIGELYFNQLKLSALKRHQSVLETKLVMGKIRRAHQL